MPGVEGACVAGVAVPVLALRARGKSISMVLAIAARASIVGGSSRFARWKATMRLSYSLCGRERQFCSLAMIPRLALPSLALVAGLRSSSHITDGVLWKRRISPFCIL